MSNEFKAIFPGSGQEFITNIRGEYLTENDYDHGRITVLYNDGSGTSMYFDRSFSDAIQLLRMLGYGRISITWANARDKDGRRAYDNDGTFIMPQDRS